MNNEALDQSEAKEETEETIKSLDGRLKEIENIFDSVFGNDRVNWTIKFRKLIDDIFDLKHRLNNIEMKVDDLEGMSSDLEEVRDEFNSFQNEYEDVLESIKNLDEM